MFRYRPFGSPDVDVLRFARDLGLIDGFAPGALDFTADMPLSLAVVDEYISPVPMISPSRS